MSRQVFILQMRVNGIKSICREIQLDFYNKLLTSFNPDLYKVKAIYGENGSGKTAIITAINIVRKIIVNPGYLSQESTQSILNELINKKTKQFSVELEFAWYGEKSLDVYRYAIVISQKNNMYEIHRESLDVKKDYTRNKKYRNLFEIIDGKIVSIADDDNAFDIIERETLNLLNKSTFAFQYLGINDVKKGIREDIIVLIMLFLSINVYLEEEDMHEMYVISKRLRESANEKELNTNMDLYWEKQFYFIDAKGRDVVERDYYSEYELKVKRLSKFLQLFKPDLKGITIDQKDDGENYKCELILNYNGYSVNREFESTGIKKLIKLFDSFTNANRGGISFIDEMDANINDVYLCKLIEYFMYYSKGQICFTTHNIDPMTVLKNNRNSIDFLSSDNTLTSWKITGNAAPDRYYKNGMIENMPFNIDAIDFIGIFGD